MRIAVKVISGGEKILIWFPAAFFLTVACNDAPVSPEAPRWVSLGFFPLANNTDSVVHSIWAEKQNLWAVTYEEPGFSGTPKAKIILYTGNRFKVSYESPAGYEYAELADIAFDPFSGTGWAGGYKEENGRWALYMLKYDPERAVWEEINAPGHSGWAISRVMPINENECWVLLDDSYQSGDRDGVLAKYARGKFEIINGLGRVTAVRFVTTGFKGTIYAVSCAREGSGEGEPPKVYISPDDGLSWFTEDLPPNAVPNNKIISARAGACFGSSFYLITEHEKGAWGVVKRSGPLGRGHYELIFLAFRGPYFYELKSIAFRSAASPPHGFSADGVGVGINTTIIFDERNILVERLPYAINFAQVIPDAGNGFFAAGQNTAFGGVELFYHP